ncbi:FliA/WhiG family RNA polymerase sigma factor [Vallitalea okinawensis]|uniref:FliA/WhiG family RNA polymerase sigma factor n=1 Tax=Vallitalea okinawensis TaxID=2078660 RepID=UPI000CFDC30C|nr:FliA/WhiG family RNA polymerase sigma factor [Vallitalea okinawensis]
MPDKNIEKIWIEYKKTHSSDSKEKLIEEYVSLVKYVAGRLNIYLGNNVEYDDLLGYGYFGLIDALDKYDLNKGVKFETYASLRIRGAILDNIRKIDWVPRSLRQKQKDLEKAYTSLEIELGRPATDVEVAAQLNMNMKEFNKLVSDTNISNLVSLEDYVEQHNGNHFNLKDNSEYQPEKVMEKNETIHILGDMIDLLPEKEQIVITLYYYEELTLKEISLILGVSESRISQLHSKALSRLRGKLAFIRN